MTRPLPASPDLGQLRSQAKDLLRAARTGDPKAIHRFHEHHPRLSLHSGPSIPDAPLRLTDAQLVIAREYGFPSWPRLKHHVESLAVQSNSAHYRPFHTEIAYYADRASGLLAVHRDGHKQAIDAIRRYHPKFAGSSAREVAAAELTDEDARLVVARQHGCDNWSALESRVEALAGGRLREPFLEAFRAIESGDLEALRGLIADEPGLVRAKGTNGNDLLGLAGSCRRHDAVRLLLEAGADVDAQNERGWTVLHQAAYANDADLANIVLAAGARIDLCAHGDGGTPLLMALFWGHREMADRLASLGIVPLNLRTTAGIGRVDLMKPFFRQDGSLTPEAGRHRGFYRPHSGFPTWKPSSRKKEILDEALVYASKSGRLQAMELLAAHGADVNAEPYNGSALHWAASCGLVEAAAWLLDHGAEIGRKTRFGGVYGVTPLHVAAWGNRLELIRFLVERGADQTTRDDNHHGLPIGWAAFNGRKEAEILLGELGSHVDIHIAAIAGRADQVKVLLDRDPALANHHDGRQTPIHDATGFGRIGIVELLLDYGADPNAVDSSGARPFAKAIDRGQDEIAEMLRSRGATG